MATLSPDAEVDLRTARDLIDAALRTLDAPVSQSNTPVYALSLVHSVLFLAQSAQDSQVALMRDPRGAFTWKDIGRALLMTRQAAQQRYGDK